MSALKWTAAEMRHVLGRAPIEAAVIDKGDHAVAVVLAHSHRDDCATVDEAKAAVEKHMLSLLTDLQSHFAQESVPAPVLRWSNEGARRVGRIDGLPQWSLAATHVSWRLFLNGCCVYDKSDEHDGHEAQARAAEAALRSLGVAFRVEGE